MFYLSLNQQRAELIVLIKKKLGLKLNNFELRDFTS